jgi:predicted nucleic acid-binding protein
MLEYIIDTNVIMSMLISGKSHYRTVLTFFKFYLPEFSLSELNEYKQVIMDKTKFSKSEYIDFVYFVFSTISVIPTFALSKESVKTAK